MSGRSLQFGDIVTAKFPEQLPQGREQEGYRPAIIVGLPDVLGAPRFPLVVVVPLTTDRQQTWADQAASLYPRLPVGTAGLRSASIVLLDQIRALDVNQVTAFRGSLSSEYCQMILHKLQQIINNRL